MTKIMTTITAILLLTPATVFAYDPVLCGDIANYNIDPIICLEDMPQIPNQGLEDAKNKVYTKKRKKPAPRLYLPTPHLPTPQPINPPPVSINPNDPVNIGDPVNTLPTVGLYTPPRYFIPKLGEPMPPQFRFLCTNWLL